MATTSSERNSDAPRRASDKLLIAVLACALVSACSVKRTAVNILGDALSGGGGAYTSDNDPDLIREALPFGLKTYESLLDVSPEHEGLLLAAAKGFTAYAYLLQDEADRKDATDLPAARALRKRARNLYLRGRDYALRGLAVSHDGFAKNLRKDMAATLAKTKPEDTPFLYWGGAAWAGALSAAKDDLNLMLELPFAAAMVRRSMDLDETYEQGAAHEFFISYEGGRPGGDVAKARRHYKRALELSGGTRSSVYLALAQAVVIKEQNAAEFRGLLEKALKVDPDAIAEIRLANYVARRRALWLKSRIPDLFVVASIGENSQ